MATRIPECRGANPAKLYQINVQNIKKTNLDCAEDLPIAEHSQRIWNADQPGACLDWNVGLFLQLLKVEELGETDQATEPGLADRTESSRQLAELEVREDSGQDVGRRNLVRQSFNRVPQSFF